MNPLDEVPISGCGAYKWETELPAMEEDTDTTGPLETRLVAGLWKTKVQALHDFQDLSSDDAIPHISAVVNLLKDANLSVCEAAIQAISRLTREKTSLMQGFIDQIVTWITEKGALITKSSIKSAVSDLVLDIYEQINDVNVVFAGLRSGFDHKNPKIQAAALSLSTGILRSFGHAQYPIAEIAAAAGKLAGSSVPQVRTEAVALMQEAHRWSPGSVLPLLDSLKKSQSEELKTAFQTQGGPPAPLRFPKRPISVSQTALASSFPDPPVRLPPKDIFDKYDESWVEQVLSLEKWTLRKEALESLNQDIGSNPLAERSPTALVTLAKQALKDSNLQVNLQAVRLTGLLAKGQGSYFEPFSRQLIPSLLLKLRDKKLAAEVQTAFHHMLTWIKLPTLIEDFMVVFKDKQSTAKVQLMDFISKEVNLMSEKEVKGVLGCYFPLLKVTMEDNTEEVRKAAVMLTAAMLKKTGETTIQTTFRELSANKIKEIQDILGVKTDSEPAKNAEVRLKSNPAVAKKAVPVVTNAGNPETEMVSEETVVELVEAILPGNIKAGLDNPAWKEKQRGFQDLTTWLRENREIAQLQVSNLVKYMSLKCKKWKENNLNIIKSALEAVETLVTEYVLDWKTVENLLSTAVALKLGEGKYIEILHRINQGLCEKHGPKKVTSVLMRETQDSSKPKQVSETCDVLTRVIDEFGPGRIDKNAVVTYGKKLVGESNSVIRKAGQGLLVSVYRHVGEEVLQMLGSLSKHTLDALKEDFAKVTVVSGATYRETVGGEEPSKTADKVNISGKISRNLLGKMNSGDWKERKEALDVLESILREVRGQVAAAGLSDLMQMLRLRLTDSNKTLQRGYLSLSGRLADLLSSEGRIYSKTLLSSTLTCLTDKQPQTRSLAIQTFDKWAKCSEPDVVINLCGQALAQDNAELRLELLQWLVSVKEQLRKSNQALVAPILTCLQDRVLAIRNAAELVLSEIMDFLPTEVLETALTDLKPTIVTTLQPILNKYRKSDGRKIVGKTTGPKLEEKRNAFNPVPLATWLAQGSEERLSSFTAEATSVLPLDLAAKFTDLGAGLSSSAASIKQLVKSGGAYSYHSLIFKWLHLLWTQRITVELPLLRQIFEPVIGLYIDTHTCLMDVDVSVIAPFFALNVQFMDITILENLLESLVRVCSPCTLYNQIVAALLVEIHPGYQGIGWTRLLAVKASQSLQPALDSKALVSLYEVAPTIGREIIETTSKAVGDRFWSLFSNLKDTEIAIFQRLLDPVRSPIGLKPHKSVSFQLPTDPAPNPVSDIMTTMQSGSLSEKVDALTSLCELIAQPESNEFRGLQDQLSALITAFDVMFKGIYKAQVIPGTFAKFAVKVVAKVCGEKRLAEVLGVSELRMMADMFLKGLLHDQLQRTDPTPDSLAGLLNLAFVLLMENAKPTSMYQALFHQIRLYSTEITHPRMIPALLKCILKMTRALDVFLPRLDVPQLILSMYELLESVPRPASSHGDDSLAKMTKTIINELVKNRKAALWEDYTSVKTQLHDDQNIARWIGVFMSSHGIEAGSVYQRVRSPLKARKSSNDTVVSIFDRLKEESLYPDAVKELQEYMHKHPESDLSEHINSCGEELTRRIQTDLEATKPKPEPEKRPESVLQSRMGLIKMRFGLQSGSEGSENQVTTGTPKTSMLSLKQKWEYIKANKNMAP